MGFLNSPREEQTSERDGISLDVHPPSTSTPKPSLIGLFLCDPPNITLTF